MFPPATTTQTVTPPPAPSRPPARPTRALSLRLPTTRKDVTPVAALAPAAPMRRRRRRWRTRLCAPRRTAFVLLALVVCCVLAALARMRRSRAAPPSAPPLPDMPLDKGMHAIAVWEQELPGNKLPPMEDGTRYVRFLNENWGVGFNNQLQEIILHAHLAHLANRTYVLPPLNFPGSDAWHPLAAFVRGALAGSPTPIEHQQHRPQHPLTDTTHPDPAPWPMRAVTRDHFLRACDGWEDAPRANYSALAARFSPEFARRDDAYANEPAGGAAAHAVLTAQDTNTVLGLEADPAGDAVLAGWARVLRSMPERCVTLSRDSAHIFDFELFGSPRVQPLLPGLLRSPVLRDLHWSALVHGAAQRNLRRWGWLPPDPRPDTDTDTHAPLPGVLALHLRRGDYQDHCAALSAWGSAFLGVNEALMLPADRFIPPDRGNTTPDLRAAFARHCWPELPDIVARARAVREQWDAARPRGFWRRAPRLRRVYVLTNGDGAWWAGVRAALVADGWDDVRGSREADFVEAGAEAGARAESERVVGQAVDMALGVRAEVFLGNGFSSLTANVNLLRLARGAPAASMRFW